MVLRCTRDDASTAPGNLMTASRGAHVPLAITIPLARSDQTSDLASVSVSLTDNPFIVQPIYYSTLLSILYLINAL